MKKIVIVSPRLEFSFSGGENYIVSLARHLSEKYEVHLITKPGNGKYFNALINSRKLTLNQLGNESQIKKGIYDLTIDKIPTKNHLIMLSFALRLNKEERKKLFQLAKEKIVDKSNSNMYSFESDNKRDKLLLHWLDDIDQLEKIVKERNKYNVEIVNDILRESQFEILR